MGTKDVIFRKEISEELDKKLARLFKKNKKQILLLDKKIEQIMNNPLRFKNLRNDLKGIKRVHIDKHFVLLFEVDKEKKFGSFP